MVAGYAGWFLNHSDPLCFIVNDRHEVEKVVRRLVRMGYDRLPGYLDGGMHAWDLITAFDQAIATGLYIYSVENLETGHIQTGKFAVIK